MASSTVEREQQHPSTAAAVATVFELRAFWEVTVRLLPPPVLASRLVVAVPSSGVRDEDAQLLHSRRHRAAELIVGRGVYAKVTPHPGDEGALSAAPSLAEVLGCELETGARYLVAYGDGKMPSLSFAVNGCGVTIAARIPTTTTTTPNARIHVTFELGPRVAAGDSTPPHDPAADRAALEAYVATCVTLHAPPPSQLLQRRESPVPRVGMFATTTEWSWPVDLHSILHEKRVSAARATTTTAAEDTAALRLGPRVLVCGGRRGVGRSMVCRTLANYAVRSGFHPLLISTSLDGLLGPAPPGCLSACVVQHRLPVDAGTRFVPSLTAMLVPFGGAAHHTDGGPNHHHDTAAAVADHRSALLSSPEGRAAMAYSLSALMSSADERTRRYRRCRCAGLLLDAPPDDGSDGYADLLLEMVECVGIDMIVFVGGSSSVNLRNRVRLRACRGVLPEESSAATKTPAEVSGHLLSTSHTSLITPTTGDEVQLILVPSMPGATRIPVLSERDRADLVVAAAWRCAFFGTPTTRVAPVTVVVPFDRLLVVDIGLRSDAQLQGLLPMTDDGAGDRTAHRGGGPTVQPRYLTTFEEFLDAVSPSDEHNAADRLPGVLLGVSSAVITTSSDDGANYRPSVPPPDDVVLLRGFAVVLGHTTTAAKIQQQQQQLIELRLLLSCAELITTPPQEEEQPRTTIVLLHQRVTLKQQSTG